MVRVLFILMLFSSCASRNRTVDIEKTRIEEVSHVDSTSINLREFHSTKDYSKLDLLEFSTLFNELNWMYEGNEDDTFKLKVTTTEDGYTAEMSGSGRATGGQISESGWESQYFLVEAKYDSLVNEFNALRSETKYQLNALRKDKAVAAQSTGWSFGGYVWLLVAIVLLFLAWRMKLFR